MAIRRRLGPTRTVALSLGVLGGRSLVGGALAILRRLELRRGHPREAKNIPVYCSHGVRARAAEKLLRAAGDEAHNLGGVSDW